MDEIDRPTREERGERDDVGTFSKACRKTPTERTRRAMVGHLAASIVRVFPMSLGARVNDRCGAIDRISAAAKITGHASLAATSGGGDRGPVPSFDFF